jgi:hypothetical protein
MSLPTMTESRLEELYQQYLKQRFLPEWARIKAKNQIIEERANRIFPMRIPKEQTVQGDLD